MNPDNAFVTKELFEQNLHVIVAALQNPFMKIYRFKFAS